MCIGTLIVYVSYTVKIKTGSRYFYSFFVRPKIVRPTRSVPLSTLPYIGYYYAAGGGLPDQVLRYQARRPGRQLQLEAPDHSQVHVSEAALHRGYGRHLCGPRPQE
jgi:hypothetical protein